MLSLLILDWFREVNLAHATMLSSGQIQWSANDWSMGARV